MVPQKWLHKTCSFALYFRPRDLRKVTGEPFAQYPFKTGLFENRNFSYSRTYHSSEAVATKSTIFRLIDLGRNVHIRNLIKVFAFYFTDSSRSMNLNVNRTDSYMPARCAGFSESSLFAYMIWYLFTRRRPFQ